MKLIDTHTHLYLEEFALNRDSVISRAIDSGVEILLLPAVDSSSVEGMIDLCGKYPAHCFPMIGLHPTSVKVDFQEELRCVEMELEKGIYIAVGEIGIDLYWDKTYLKEQSEVFLLQLALAEKYNLPVVIHTRGSFKETYELLNKFSNRPMEGIFHCFSGNTEEALKVIEKGFKIGVGGVVTYKNAVLAEVVKDVDLKHIVLETDAPYLSPVPFRGKCNESSYLTLIAAKVAEIKNVPIEKVAEITTKNACQIFKKLFQ